MEYCKNSSSRELCNDMDLHYKKKSTQINNLPLYLTVVEKEQNKSKFSKRKEVTKIGVQITKIEARKII